MLFIIPMCCYTILVIYIVCYCNVLNDLFGMCLSFFVDCVLCVVYPGCVFIFEIALNYT